MIPFQEISYPMTNVGKTTTIFLGLIIVLLVSTASISIFLLSKETEKRKAVESELNKAQDSLTKLQGDLKVAQNKVFILEEKNKEADTRINNLEEELDVEKGLKEAMKNENDKLKQDLDGVKQERDSVTSDWSKKLEDAQNKSKAVEQELQTQQSRVKELEAKISDLDKHSGEAVSTSTPTPASATPVTPAADAKDAVVAKPEATVSADEKKVELDKIVVNAPAPSSSVKGRVLSIDKDTEFIIFDLGSKNGVKQGDMMSVYRGDEFLGDVKVSRVQEEMSAADLIPPFTSRMVRKNDSVVPKP
jgi:peptidoglycan hydrolase CwlO-like protein